MSTTSVGELNAAVHSNVVISSVAEYSKETACHMQGFGSPLAVHLPLFSNTKLLPFSYISQLPPGSWRAKPWARLKTFTDGSQTEAAAQAETATATDMSKSDFTFMQPNGARVEPRPLTEAQDEVLRRRHRGKAAASRRRGSNELLGGAQRRPDNE